METLSVPTALMAAVKLCLKDFGPEENLPGADEWPKGFRRHDIPCDTIPVPEVLRLCLVRIIGCHWTGPSEKIRWIVPFSYRGTQCCFALQKFGLRLYLHECVPEIDQETTVVKIIGRLNRACRILEKKVLAPFAREHVDRGNITVANYYLQLSNMYQYFRRMAEANFAPSTPDLPSQDDPEPGTDGHLTMIVNRWNQRSRRKWAGFYNTVAMIDAYFSRLEHLLVLAVPCVCWTGPREPLTEFVGQSWGTKYQRVFHIGNDRDAKEFHDRLRSIKERYRNTFAHGGFEKGGASFLVHVPSLGALPVPFSGIRESPAFQTFPVSEAEFSEICRLFDAFDGWVKRKLHWVTAYAESGLNLACDDKSLDQLRQASRDPQELEQLIERWSWEVDRDTNMDY